MPAPRLIPSSEFIRSLWKNGLGHTDQIAIEPAGADLRKGDYLWRISSASIENASDFSIFPEHDRALVVLSGSGLRLFHSDDESGYQDSVDLPPLEPYEFPGDIKSRCQLIDGPVKDLSAFFRKDVMSASLEVIRTGEEAWLWEPQATWNFLISVRGVFEIALSEEEVQTLPEGAAFSSEAQNESYPVVPHGPGAILIAIRLWKNG